MESDVLKALPDNPPNNKLSTSTQPEQVLAAVRKSGYPLQTRVANLLRTDGFLLQEEWSYGDPQAESLRALDVLAQKHLYDREMHPQPRARPILSLLIECKQSDLPYIFFAGAKTRLQTFPVFAGLFGDRISISTDDSRSTWSCGIAQVLSLHTLPFTYDDPIFCMTFSKCVRKGKELELSGSEPFQSLVLPLVKSIRHLQKHVAPPKTAHYHDCHLVLGIAVLDAPMLLAEVGGDDCQLTLAPWVRVVRYEAVDGVHEFDRSQSYGIDVIHKDYLSLFLNEKVMPFGQLFSERALKHDVELATGKGFATGMEKDGWLEIHTRLMRK